MEYELLLTGVFNEDWYFDVFIGYAEASPEDLLVKTTSIHRGPDASELHDLIYINGICIQLRKHIPLDHRLL